ncbi:MAG: hypothetical protein ACLGIN_09780, partial [Candidatus Sericytochromatia bacterium]
ACAGLGDNVKAEPIMQTVLRDLYDGVPMAKVEKAPRSSAAGWQVICAGRSKGPSEGIVGLCSPS